MINCNNSKKIVIIVMALFFLSALTTLSIADIKKPISKSNVQIPEKVKNPIVKLSHIDWLSPDFFSGQVIEVWGKNFGLLTSNKKFYLGNTIAIIKHWSKDFILLEYPDSPVLGTKLDAYIKQGITIISNKEEFTLAATMGLPDPKQIFENYKPFTSIKVSASFSGINKVGMKVRFRKKINQLLTKPKYGKILSIIKGGEDNTINTLVPSGLVAGLYLIDLIQDGRVASDSAEFRVKKKIIFNKKINIK